MSILQKKIRRFRSGGQSGVDRAAMDFAREQGIPLWGRCPKNGWAADLPDIIKWISGLSYEIELCIGGPRASECPEAYDVAKAVLNGISDYCFGTSEAAEKQRKDTVHMDPGNQLRRVLVIGSPGAGKSTFSRKLRDRTGLPLYYLDLIYHNPDRTTVNREVFDARLSEILETDRWIIDGNYQRTLPLRFEKCTEVFFFDLPVEECLMGAQSRIGQKREDMPWIEEAFDPEFRQYILDFSKDQLPHIYHLLEQYADSKTINIFHSREEADAWLRQ